MSSKSEDIEHASHKQEKMPHASKEARLPRTYKEVKRILGLVKLKKKSIKSALYESRFRGQLFKKLYAISYGVLQNLPVINHIIDEVGLLTKEAHLNEEVAQILVYELAIKGSDGGCSKPAIAVQQYKAEILDAYEKSKEGSFNKVIPFHPCYVRIHTLVTTVEEVVESLEKYGFQQVYLDSEASMSSFHALIKSLKPGEFVRDFHFNDVLVFPPGQNFADTYLYRKGHIFLQDKASLIPVYALDPPLHSTVIDSCAAPGMKTVHIASVMNNTGKIYAFDHHESRFRTLKSTLKQGHVLNCSASHADFMEIDPHKEEYASVEYILVDPSCSGSGMISRLDYVTDDDESKSASRIFTLSKFQISILKHALSFPKVKRVVYSTCSVNEEENEYVIKEALSHYCDVFEVINVFPKWTSRGLKKYRFGRNCCRASAEKDLTNGFFVAAIQRIGSNKNVNPLKEPQWETNSSANMTSDVNYPHKQQQHNLSSSMKLVDNRDETMTGMIDEFNENTNSKEVDIKVEDNNQRDYSSTKKNKLKKHKRHLTLEDHNNSNLSKPSDELDIKVEDNNIKVEDNNQRDYSSTKRNKLKKHKRHLTLENYNNSNSSKPSDEHDSFAVLTSATGRKKRKCSENNSDQLVITENENNIEWSCAIDVKSKKKKKHKKEFTLDYQNDACSGELTVQENSNVVSISANNENELSSCNKDYSNEQVINANIEIKCTATKEKQRRHKMETTLKCQSNNYSNDSYLKQHLNVVDDFTTSENNSTKYNQNGCNEKAVKVEDSIGTDSICIDKKKHKKHKKKMAMESLEQHSSEPIIEQFTAERHSSITSTSSKNEFINYSENSVNNLSGKEHSAETNCIYTKEKKHKKHKRKYTSDYANTKYTPELKNCVSENERNQSQKKRKQSDIKI